MTVFTPRGSLHVTDQPGDEPALILMHGFPDDSHIYDRLVPLLAPRRAVTFDFLGYGRSDRSEASAGDVANHHQDLAAVVDSLGVEQVALIAHDASGPVAIDYAINEPDRVSHLVLLNTYYGHAPMLRLPEMIRLFADEHFAPLADALVADPDQRLWLLQHTARRFGSEELDPAGIEAVSVMPQFFGDADIPDALAAIRGWTGALFAELQRQDEQIATGQLASLDVPVALPFGELDEYLSPDLGRHLAGLFPRAELRLVEGASHWPQWDQPDAVAQLVKELAT
jgi:pimeloyl-ACP methyl ester carboxylesterase